MKTIKITKDVKDSETGEFLKAGDTVEREAKRADAIVKAGYAQHLKIEETPKTGATTEEEVSSTSPSTSESKPKKTKKTQPSPKVKKKSK